VLFNKFIIYFSFISKTEHIFEVEWVGGVLFTCARVPELCWYCINTTPQYTTVFSTNEPKPDKKKCTWSDESTDKLAFFKKVCYLPHESFYELNV
jgi:hypothetical protein